MSDQVRAGLMPTPGRVAAVVRASSAPDQVIAETRAANDDFLGLGPLSAFVTEQSVTDVLVNPNGSVWVDRGRGPERTGVTLDPSAAEALATRLAARAGRRLDQAMPWVDGLLPGNIRLHALLPPVAVGGTTISLRVPRRGGFTLEQLAAGGLAPQAGVSLLRQVVSARVSFLISGGTGTGKTTLLAALLGLVPAQQRIVLVEDVQELPVDHPHVVRLQARAPNVEGAGRVDLTDLVRQALRMRPDRLVVGEVRGAEVRDLLAALNTGHEGGCGTIHANGIEDLPARLEALAALAGLTREAAMAQVASAIQCVVHLAREDSCRRVVGIGVLARTETGLRAIPAVRFTSSEVVSGPAADRLAALGVTWT